jgi:peptidoglycan-associated lipoprotein
MKRAALLNLFIVALALSLGAVGCKRGPKSLTYIPGQGSHQLQTPPPSDFSGTFGDDGVVGGDLGGSGGLADRASLQELLATGEQDRSTFAAQTVYFAFDSSVVRPADVSKVEVVAMHLRSNPGHAVIIEGHCDERGTEEYNRSLGERRALSVRELMVRMGADAGRIHTISYGEDVPVDSGKNEAAWAKNRRGEFVLLRPKN